MTFRRTAAPTAALTVCALLGACGAPSPEKSGTGGTDGKPSVVVGFYPLQYAAERIGGDRIHVTNLTRPGGEPHDAELTPKDVAAVADADLAVHEKGMQPALDDAVAAENPDKAFDVATVAQLDAPVPEPVADLGGDGHDHAHGDEHAHEEGHEEGHEGHDHAHEGEGHEGEEKGHEGHSHDHGTVDPHFWLDPVRYEAVAAALTERLSQVDPEGKATYEANLADLRRDLEAVDAEYEKGLEKCRSTTLVTGHAAFGYLAARYGLTQAAISGLSPESEPDPARLAAVADYVRKHDVSTIYAETLTSPAVAETVARETGARTAVLDPIEGLTKDGTDYLGLMRSNLATLRTGQGCS
ncbi:metal ABC transporter substrate-binding protein [Mobilicoccus pelagius]|uniref:Putative metal ABC transporter substrate binding protein n=1 Tax=Mobilicoccus pelagius NBRC 104925 TaxID=1089455 RepID=H5UQH7_9MICO|nr:zinc ABC transporter substrate-binding protein [Mobilicoccus pelagius]GAB47985.1 putative metal ABC transporter substrate binding protein [Mobilicoccus pelagius NBRC 104925]